LREFLTRLIARVRTAPFVRVLGVLAVDATGLEVLVFPIVGTLPAVAFVIIVTAIIAELVLLVSAMLTMMVATIVLIV
jgi:hypothetical protein